MPAAAISVLCVCVVFMYHWPLLRVINMNSLQMCCILKCCQRKIRSICAGDSRRPLEEACWARLV